jgi:tRNA(Ile)-lysidine synthase
MGIVESVEGYIGRHGLLDKNGRYLVALSGGADSVALLRILLALGYIVEAAHCNFHLRGEESNRDERFVVNLCNKLGVQLHLVHFDTLGYAKLHGQSIEMAARNLRYSYFRNLANDIAADAICVAHHRDDSVETLLINLLRGTGIHGLTGIKPRNGNIIRPLLCLSRSDIENYLHDIAQDYVTDSTNFVDDVVRNKIRLNVLPLLREINPSVSQSIQSTAERIGEAVKVFDHAIGEAVQRVSRSESGVLYIDISLLRSVASPESVLFHLLTPYGFAPALIEQIGASLDVPTGKVFSSPTHTLLFNRGQIVVAETTDNFKPMRFPESGVYVVNGMRWRVDVADIDSSFAVSRQPNVATLDASGIVFPLTVRRVVEGDRFVPFGMKGSKLVSDFMTDRKMNLFEKQRQLVVVDSSGRILWLVGLRTDNRYRITESTERAVVISNSPLSP